MCDGYWYVYMTLNVSPLQSGKSDLIWYEQNIERIVAALLFFLNAHFYISI